MQVSWIDPNEVRHLLMQIAGPVASPGPTAWETHTYPLGEEPPAPTDEAARLPVQVAPSLPATPVAPAPPVQQPTLSPPPAAPLQPLPGIQTLAAMPAPSAQPAPSIVSLDPIAPIQEATQAANTELERIRQRLRELRERAQQSGVISATPSPSPAPMAPLPTAELASTAPAETPAASPAVGLPPLMQPMEELAPQPDSGPLNYGGTETDAAQLVQPSIEQPFSIAPIQLASAAATPQEAPPQPPASSIAPVSLTTAAFAPRTTAPTLPHIEQDNPRVDKPTFQAPDRGLTERLAALAQWACQRLQTQEVVLVDDFGDVLWGSPGHTALVLSGMMAWHSAQRANALQHMEQLSRRIDREMQGGQQLTIIPVRTRYGVVSLAAICPKIMEDADVDAIHQALAVAIEGTG
jgi:hypothetical protein